MRRSCWLVAASALLLACVAPPPGDADEAGEAGEIGEVASALAADKLVRAPDAIPGEYLVVLRPTAAGRDANVAMGLAEAAAAAQGARITRRYGAALIGFAAEMSEAAAREIAAREDVERVEQNAIVRASEVQATPTWGLDRIDQVALPLDARYLQLGDGAGATIYVVDSGVRATHGELAGRVAAGFSAIDDGRGTDDCNGHGTHVAGTAAGASYGVAKRAQLVPVRVLDCEGNGTTATVVAGIDWVAANRSGAAVANLSLGSGESPAIDTAVRSAVAAGVIVVVAAGNEAIDACARSPAREPAAITVGATTSADERSAFSNYGACVDLSAPGSGITSAWNTSDAATNRLDGTSMAAPHVAGALASYRAAHPGASAAEATAALLAGTSRDRLRDQRGSPNRLLSTRFVDGAAPLTAITAPADNAQVGASFSVRVDARDANLETVGLLVDGVVVETRTQPPFEFTVRGLAPGRHAISATALDLAALASTASIAVSVGPGGDAAPTAADDLVGGCAAAAGGGAGLIPLLAAWLVSRGRARDRRPRRCGRRGRARTRRSSSGGRSRAGRGRHCRSRRRRARPRGRR